MSNDMGDGPLKSPDGRHFWDPSSGQWIPVPPEGAPGAGQQPPNFPPPPSQQGQYPPPPPRQQGPPTGPPPTRGTGLQGYGPQPGQGYGPQPGQGQWPRGSSGPGHSGGPNFAGPKKSSGGATAAKIIGGIVAAFLVLGACGAVFGGGGAPDQEDTSAADLAESIGSGESSMPATEGEFLSAVGTGQEVAADGNELQIVEARKARAEAICNVLGDSLKVQDWVGVVESVETTTGGDGGVLSVEIAEDVAVQTWSNGLSDIGTGSLVDPESPVWDQMVDLSEGDEIVFSGRFDDSSDCVTESSVMDQSGMETPDFIFIFSDIQPAPQ